MKITLRQIEDGSEEIIIQYRQMTERLAGIIKYLEGQGERLLGEKEGAQFVVNVADIIYLESVEGAVFLYTEKEIYKSGLTLALFESLYAASGFFRCSKSTVLNLYRIKKLKSIPGNRIDAMLDNGEHIMISRRYAKELRSILKGEAE